MSMPVAITRLAGNLTMKATKYGPTVAIGAGCVGVVVACVMACKKTSEAKDVIEGVPDSLEHVKSKGLEPKIERKEIVDIYKDTAIELVKVYGPAALVGAGSLGCIIFSHKVMVGRVATLSAAYMALDDEFRNYRRRIADYISEKGDELFKDGLEKSVEDVEITDEETGKVKKKKEDRYYRVAKPVGYSQYAQIFDDHCSLWQDNCAANLNMLQIQEKVLTDKLRRNGHLFLNEVYDAIGMDRTPVGARAGWIIGKGDDYVSFNLQDFNNRAFLCGWEPSVWLDFNCCGEIWDLI